MQPVDLLFDVTEVAILRVVLMVDGRGGRRGRGDCLRCLVGDDIVQKVHNAAVQAPFTWKRENGVEKGARWQSTGRVLT